MDPKQTAQRIADNDLNELDVNWRDYQQLVWWLVCRETEINGNETHTFETTNAEDKGVVDVLVKLRMPSVTIFDDAPFRTDRELFIECKRYRTTVTLDKIGKIFCHSILEQPDALWIVSPRRLSAQAGDYAQKIFATNSTERRPLLPRTNFRHWRLKDLINGSTPAGNLTEIDVADWQIVQVTAYGSALIASASSSLPSSTRRVDAHERTAFRLRMIFDDPPNSIDGVELALLWSDERGATTLAPLSGYTHLREEALEVDIVLPRPAQSRCLQAIHIRDRSGNLKRKIQVGPLRFHQFDPAIIDLRPQEPRILAQRIASGDDPKRVVCCVGAAGVGKSTLLERVGWVLAREHGWDVRAHTITEGTDSSLFFDLLQWFVLAIDETNAPGCSTNSFDLRNTIISAIAFQHSQLRSPEAVQTLIESAAQGTINDAQIQELCRVLCHVAQRRASPLLVILRDAHLASPAISNGLSRLLLRLRDEGWGNVRFIVEARSADTSGAPWPETIAQLSEQLGGDISFVDIFPLSLIELHAAVAPRVKCPDIDAAVRSIHKLTGGFPLFVDQLFRDLMTRGILLKDAILPDFYQLDVNALVGLRLDRIPAQVSRFLLSRMDQATRATSELLAVCLGVIAQVLRVAPDGAPRWVIQDLISGPSEEGSRDIDESLQFAIGLGLLRSHDAGRMVLFAHDAMLLAAQEFARTRPAFVRAGARIVAGHASSSGLDPFKSHLLRARLAGDICEQDRALEHALLAEASAAQTGNLVQRRMALECSLATLLSNDRPNHDWIQHELAVRERLIWTVMQQASQHLAWRVIESTEQRISNLRDVGLITTSEQAVAAFHCARCRVVIATRGLDAQALLAALPVMCRNAIETTQVHYALTRLVILAMEIDDVRSARRGIEYCLRLPVVDADPDAFLSFLSEIGDIFAIDQPDVELLVRRNAHELAENLVREGRTDSRSLAHAKVSLLIAEALSDPWRVDEAELGRLKEEYERHGFLNPLVRLMNLLGFVAAVKDRPGADQDAFRIWTDCAELADVTNHRLIRWHVLQNLKRLRTLRGEEGSAKSLALAAHEISGPFFKAQSELNRVVVDCLDHLLSTAPLNTAPNWAMLPVPIDHLDRVRHVGQILRHAEVGNSWCLI